MRPQWEIDAIDRLDDAAWVADTKRRWLAYLAAARLRSLVKVKKGRGQRRNRRNRQ